MANIRVDVQHTIKDGYEVVFVAPCDCSEISGLSVYYPDKKGVVRNKVFKFVDTHGNELTTIDNLFAKDTYVKVLLSVTNGHAFIQNADTNAYLEGRFNEKSDNTHTHSIKDLTENPINFYETLANKIQMKSYVSGLSYIKEVNVNENYDLEFAENPLSKGETFCVDVVFDEQIYYYEGIYSDNGAEIILPTQNHTLTDGSELSVTGSVTQNSANIVISGKVISSVINTRQIVVSVKARRPKLKDSYISKDTLLRAHPIGSVLITSDNTNPAETLGGTWELIDKEFEPKFFDSKIENIASLVNATDMIVYINRVGHTLSVHTEFTIGIDLKDSSQTKWLSLEPNTIGLTPNESSKYLPWLIRYMLYSDSANGIVFAYVDSTDLAITSVDCLVRDSSNTGSIASGTYFHGDFDIVCSPELMDDTACNKFYWKRVPTIIEMG